MVTTVGAVSQGCLAPCPAFPDAGTAISLREVDLAGLLGADLAHDVVAHRRRGGAVHPHLDQRVTTAPVAARLHAGDVDRRLTEDTTDRADDAGPVDVAEHGHVVGER